MRTLSLILIKRNTELPRGNVTLKTLYHAKCKHCSKGYVGMTTQKLNGRISGHRGKFTQFLYDDTSQLNDEDNLLGLHLFHKHHLNSKTAFDDSYSFTILEKCNPIHLDLKEHVWVQKMKCVAPYGLNSDDPFGLESLWSYLHYCLGYCYRWTHDGYFQISRIFMKTMWR